MGKHLSRGRVGVLVLALILACSSITSALAAPRPPAAATTSMYAASQVQRFGVETNIATRFGRLGQMKQPMDLVQQMGAGVILEQFKWEFIEQPACGQYRWDYYDELVTQAKAHNLEIVGQLGYNNIACQIGQEDRGVPDLGRWKAFVAAVINRYHNDVHKWEVWNEPDNPEFWKGTPQQYVALLQATYQLIKSLDPSAQVSNGACSQLDLVLCDQIIAAGGLASSDAFGFHPYVGKDNFDNGLFKKLDLPHLQNRQQANGNKPLRFTETGWSSANPGSSGNAVGPLQGRYMVEQIVTMLGFTGINIDQLIWYDFRDDGAPNSQEPPVSLFENGSPGPKPPSIIPDIGDGPASENHFGLIQNDWQTPKPSFFAYQQMAGHLAGALAMGPVDRGDGGIAYRFNRNGTVVDVVWGGGKTSLATEAREVQAYDLSGNKLPTDMGDGMIHVAIGDDPVYIEHSKNAYGPGATSSTPPSASSGAPGTVPGAGSPATGPTSASVSPPPSSSNPNPAPAGSNIVAPPAGGGTTNVAGGGGTWTDQGKQLSLQFPSNWKMGQTPSNPQNLLELDGPDGVIFSVFMYDQMGSPNDSINMVKQVHKQSTVLYYSDNYLLDLTIGGEPGKLLNYSYVPINNTTMPPQTSKLWVVTHGGKEFDFLAINQSAHSAEVDAIAGSVVFLR